MGKRLLLLVLRALTIACIVNQRDEDASLHYS
jgi:hypothetical protein